MLLLPSLAVFLSIFTMKTGGKLTDMEGHDEHGPGTLMTNDGSQDLCFKNMWESALVCLPNELGREPVNILQAHDMTGAGTDDCLFQQEFNKGTGFKGIALPALGCCLRCNHSG